MPVFVSHRLHEANSSSELLQEGLRMPAAKQKGQVPVGPI